MVACGSLWQSVTFLGILWQSLAVCVSLWQPVAICCSLWQHVAVCCSLWQSVPVCCVLWQPVTFCGITCQPVAVYGSLWRFVAACCSLWQSFPNYSKNNVTSFVPQARRLMFARRSTPDYPFSISSVSFVFLISLLLCAISTVLWGGATSICDGIILLII